ncbi:MAG: hypothetical protein ABSB49_06225 [Polyangia bacterium]|jgi:hypothetical protein
MRAFARRGFQLRTASVETRVAYTAFLVLMLPAIATLVALSLGRIGRSPASIASYYRGGESEMSFPKSFAQLVEVSHFHLFTIPVVVLILSHLVCATPFSTRVRVWLTTLTFAGAFLDILGPWGVRYLSRAFAYPLLVGWLLLGGGAAAITILTLFAMWGPQSWLRRLTPAPSLEEDP